MLNNKILVICGPTSTGKSSLALSIAKKNNGELVSADSRQVYVGMDIGTGKDIPKDSKFIKVPGLGGYYVIDGIKLWGCDLVSPKKEFSVGQYLTTAHKIIDRIALNGKNPILVGGTGLYIKAIIDGIPTADVPKNDKVRKNLEGKSPDELYEMLSQIDSVKAGSMNTSDKKNPRRLVRAIEVAQFQLSKKSLSVHHTIGEKFEVFFVGLTAPMDFLEEKIARRVKERISAGVKDEVQNLLKSGVTWSDQSMMAIGYGGWRDYFEGEVPESQVIDDWEREEKRYAKRQMVWFKKEKRIKWFDITEKGFPKSVENLINKWYSSATNAKES